MVAHAEALNFPLLDPYLDKNGNFTHGVNFAVAGATALDDSTLAAKGIHGGTSFLSVQLDWFKSHLSKTCSTPSECRKKLGKSLFFMGEIGGNDYNYAAFGNTTMEELQALVPDVVETIMNAVRELIDLGAKRIIVPGNFPIGCMTIYLAIFKTDDRTMYDEFNCLRNLNKFAMFHNDQLQNAIEDLQQEHPDVAIVYGDYYMALMSIIEQAPSLGFDEKALYKACCANGNNEYDFIPGERECRYGASVCPDPSQRLSWDGIHLTQHTYQLMADWLLKYILPANGSGSLQVV